MKDIKVIAFDADDTLWINEPYFRNSESEFYEMMSKYLGKKDFEKELYQNIEDDLHLYGYGVKGFTLSMIEAALVLTKNKISGEDIQKLLGMGKYMLAYPIKRLPGVEETLKELSSRYKIICITKGDLLDQESKIARSGLGDYFSDVIVVSDKKPADYQKVLDRLKISSHQFMMVGNSLKSDILPVLDLGGKACHIPQEMEWSHEAVSEDAVKDLDYIKAKVATELLKIL